MSKQKLTGKVVSNKMQKTVVVEIERQIAHPIYKKRIKVTHKIKAHSGDIKLEEGDRVVIESTRPVSKTKSFKVVKKEDEKSAVSKASNTKINVSKKENEKKTEKKVTKTTKSKKGGKK